MTDVDLLLDRRLIRDLAVVEADRLTLGIQFRPGKDPPLWSNGGMMSPQPAGKTRPVWVAWPFGLTMLFTET